MTEDLRIFFHLLGPKLRGFTRLGKSTRKRSLLKVLIFGGLGLLFAFAIYMGSAWFLRRCLGVELVGALIPRKLMSMVFLILISILLLSTTISAFSVFFLSDDMNLLMSSPLPLGPLYYARFTEMLLHSSWMVVFFGLPVFLAYGQAYQAPASFYLVLALLFPAIILIPGALGAMLAAVLTRIFSARRSRDLLIVLVLVGFIFLYLMIRAMKPEQLLDEKGFGTMIEFLSMFRTSEADFLPTVWATDALFSLLENRPATVKLPLLGVWTMALALTAISGWVCTALYRSGYARAQEGRLRWFKGSAKALLDRGRLLGGWLDRLGARGGRLTGALLVKDLRVFMRDTNQWLQLLLLGALAAVYLLNFVYLKSAKFSWFTLYTINHAMLGLVISGIAVRFVFPAVSLEGRAFWLIRTAPLDPAAFLHSKLLIHFLPLALMAVGLSLLSCTIIGVPFAFMVLSIGLVLALTLCTCAMGVGIGAVYPRFTAENPAKIPTGTGGVAFMITSMSFVVAFLLVSFYPTYVLYRLPLYLTYPWLRTGWLVFSTAALVLLIIVAAWLPMVLGRRNLARLG